MLFNIPFFNVLLLLSTTSLSSATANLDSGVLGSASESGCICTATVTVTSTMIVSSTSISSSPPSTITSTTLTTPTITSSTTLKTISSSTSTNTVVAQPSAIGCFADNINNDGRTLNGPSMNSSNMTNQLCAQFCTNLEFPYSGTEFADQCFCALRPPTVTSTACTTHCSSPGSTEICGGANALSVSLNPLLGARQSELRAAYQSFGCYSDDFPARVLNGAALNSSAMTVESCLNFCQASGFSIAGVEYHNECFCDNELFTNNVTFGLANQQDCTFSCIGSPDEICGGPDFLSIYANASSVPLLIPSFFPSISQGFEAIGCFSDSTTRTLATQLSDVENVEDCIAGCSEAGFSLAGLEFTSQCFCGNEILNNSTRIDSSLCDLSCVGNATETCGGSDALQLYSKIS